MLCSLWIRALAVGMGRKLLSDLHGANPGTYGDRLLGYCFMFWAVFSIFSILPYIWQDLRTLERAKRLAPLWSGL